MCVERNDGKPGWLMVFIALGAGMLISDFGGTWIWLALAFMAGNALRG